LNEPFWVEIVRWIVWNIIHPPVFFLYKMKTLPWRKPDYNDATYLHIKVWFKEGLCYSGKRDVIYRCGPDKNGKFVVWLDIDRLSHWIPDDPHLSNLYKKWLDENLERTILG